nr:penicillin acylase family protein [Kibdelosporangium sp. MJ126-NF4]CEL13313.1 Penicillin amidase precursor [Kibdelosporangium sp. MJ126-NF4]CTQ99004.1 Penicillin amidase precursor (EC 3.5.1.11) [Kibdelosporangium sp. MJ126-NF4]
MTIGRILRSRRFRVAGLVALVIVLVTATGATGLVVWTVHRSFPEQDGEISVPGMRGAVEVVRDHWGVPQIYADDATDLMRAQGYVHAQDRFWEMDVRRHISAGRLAEMFGEGQVPTDKVVRTLGWYRVAGQEVALLSPRAREYLRAYADGVNAYLAHRDGADLSLEYAMLGLSNSGYRPDPWTPEDSVSWLKAMAWQLNSGLDTEIQRSLLGASLPQSVVDQLYPGYDYERAPIVTPAESNGAAIAPVAMKKPLPSGISGVAAVGRVLGSVLGPTGPGVGSNSWVVAGSRTTTGKPILANDPHLAPQIPSVWYQVGLRCRVTSARCPFDVAGFGFAGMPGVVIGHNRDIAWGITDLSADVSDLYFEKVTGDEYEYEGRTVPLTVIEETVSVAGGPSRQLRVRSTAHGPLVSDVLETVGVVATHGERSGQQISLRWTALEPGRTMDALFDLNSASDWRSFRAALSLLTAPAQSVIYADRAGHIGYQTTGLIPVRKTGDGRTASPGWTAEHDWTGHVPFNELPSAYDPPKGYIVTANNAVVDSGFRYPLSRDWGAGYRSQRIAELVGGAGKIDMAAMQRMQLDTHNANAAQLVPYLLAVARDPASAKAVDLLRGWDFSQSADSAAAAYFNAVWRNLLRLTFVDELSSTAADADPDGGGRWFQVIGGMLTRPEDPLWRNASDPRGLRTRDDVLRAAIQDAFGELSDAYGTDPADWRWGDMHTLELRNQTIGRSGPAPAQWMLNRGSFRLGGGNEIVNATAWSPSAGYQVVWAPSMRMVVDLADLDRSRWINQTGASGHAYHDNYDDQAELWAKGETTSWPFSTVAVGRGAQHRLVLR